MRFTAPAQDAPETFDETPMDSCSSVFDPSAVGPLAEQDTAAPQCIYSRPNHQSFCPSRDSTTPLLLPPRGPASRRCAFGTLAALGPGQHIGRRAEESVRSPASRRACCASAWPLASKVVHLSARTSMLALSRPLALRGTCAGIRTKRQSCTPRLKARRDKACTRRCQRGRGDRPANSVHMLLRAKLGTLARDASRMRRPCGRDTHGGHRAPLSQHGSARPRRRPRTPMSAPAGARRHSDDDVWHRGSCITQARITHRQQCGAPRRRRARRRAAAPARAAGPMCARGSRAPGAGRRGRRRRSK